MAENNSRGTAYKVLVPAGTDENGNPNVGTWREVSGTFTAPNDIAAIKLAEKEHGPFEHGAVAVPARSWRPRKGADKVQTIRLWT